MSKPVLITGLRQILTFNGPYRVRKGKDMEKIGLISDGAILIKDGKFEVIGPSKKVEKHPLAKKAQVIETGGVAIPGFCDSHTHPIFRDSRLSDFSLRTKGLSYVDIKKRGGGITSSIKGVRESSQKELEILFANRIPHFFACGTTAIEAKSGYGLSLDSELKSLRAIKNVSENSLMDIVPTCLSAHAVPPEFDGRSNEYLEYVINGILPIVANEGLAVFVDTFCEKGFFTAAQAKRLFEKAKKLGFKLKIHAEQLTNFGGSQTAAKVGAISVDHADFVNKKDINALKKSGTIATLLPTSNYYLGIDKYPPARDMIKAGVGVSLATDFNPGSSPCWNMQFVMSVACNKMKMTPEEALCSATINGAMAMGLKSGIIKKGAKADLAVFETDDYREIAYYFGDNQCGLTIKNGEIVYFRGAMN
jgi:imidazolonepropionase